jgi:hypothetical protein
MNGDIKKSTSWIQALGTALVILSLMGCATKMPPQIQLTAEPLTAQAAATLSIDQDYQMELPLKEIPIFAGADGHQRDEIFSLTPDGLVITNHGYKKVAVHLTHLAPYFKKAVEKWGAGVMKHLILVIKYKNNTLGTVAIRLRPPPIKRQVPMDVHGNAEKVDVAGIPVGQMVLPVWNFYIEGVGWTLEEGELPAIIDLGIGENVFIVPGPSLINRKARKIIENKGNFEIARHSFNSPEGQITITGIYLSLPL